VVTDPVNDDGCECKADAYCLHTHRPCDDASFSPAGEAPVDEAMRSPAVSNGSSQTVTNPVDDAVPNAEYVCRLVAEFVGAAIHGAIYVGRTPDGYDGATKDDVVNLAEEVASLLNQGWTLTPPAQIDGSGVEEARRD
jgi:hypothetical protein